MPTSASHPAEAQPAGFIAAPKSMFVAMLTAAGAIVLIGAEIWLAVLASLWAADGFFNLGLAGDLVMAAIIVPPAIWATWMTAKLAVSAELNPENAD